MLYRGLPFPLRQPCLFIKGHPVAKIGERLDRPCRDILARSRLADRIGGFSCVTDGGLWSACLGGAAVIYAFADCVLDVARRELTRDGGPVALEPQVFDLLVHLVRHPDRVVTRDELIEAIWGGRIVSESAVTTRLNAARKAIGDSGAEQRLIRTLSRKGIRFVGTMREPVAETVAAEIAAAPAEPIANSAVITAAVSTAAAETGPPLPDKPSIAVLPFANMSGEAEHESFADGMVQDIITELSRYRSLFVIARSSTFTYKGKTADVRQVAHALGVRYVLEGTVRRRGETVRVTAQLIDAMSGSHVWADRYDRAASDLFAIQDEITSSVASIIEPALAEAEQRRASRKPPDRLDVWEAYHRGLWHFHKNGPEDLLSAQAFFRQAIALDPNFAPGYYGYSLARLYDFVFYSTRSLAEFKEWEFAEARLAVSLDNKDDMAHAVLAMTMAAGGEWEASIVEARKAATLNPNSAFVMSILGMALGFAGYREEGIHWLRQAMRASPLDTLTWLWLNWIGDFQFFSREFGAALETFRQVICLRPRFMSPRLLSAAALAYLGRSREARDVLRSVQAERPEQIERRRHRSPWYRPEDWAIRTEGLRLADAGPEEAPHAATPRSDCGGQQPPRSRQAGGPPDSGHEVLPGHSPNDGLASSDRRVTSS